MKILKNAKNSTLMIFKANAKEGKIKYIGFSFHGTVDDLRNIVSAHKWDFAQIQMNYLDWENQNAKGAIPNP